ncbi:MAG: ribonuclease H-like domain-containing protein [Actinomycetota bacterium]|nr:ribonuclease H-like domain-containing protein [Actinomycetota bacterium]MDA8174057.1 ribonuclease H-like domain-containing protein [Nitrospiraceae bacterium]
MAGKIIFDIETAGENFDSLDEHTRQYLTRYAQTEEDLTEIKDSLSLYPLTSQIVAIGMLNPESGKGVVYFQAPSANLEPFEEDRVKYEPGTEKEVLERFWQTIKSYEQFITFNGRCFDCPFIMIRSAFHGIKAARDLMPNRYSGCHLDLLDQLSFFGAVRRRFSLDMWCRFFGIKSPKESVDGSEVKSLFEAGRYLDIARYCAGDLRATAGLYNYWSTYMRPAPEKPLWDKKG